MVHMVETRKHMAKQAIINLITTQKGRINHRYGLARG